MYTDDTNFTRRDAEANRTVSPPGPPNDLGKYTVTVTDIYDRTDTGERSGGITYTYQIDDIKDANRFDIGGDGVHLEDHRTIEVIDNDTNQTIKTIDLEFGDHGELKERVETGQVENNTDETYKDIDRYSEDGEIKYSASELHNSHGYTDYRVEVVYSDQKSSCAVESYYDENGKIDYQKVTEKNSDGYPISVHETIPHDYHEYNIDPVESNGNGDHVDKQTVEQHREDGTLESKTVILYDDEKNPMLEIKTSYSEDGKHVEKTERTDYFEKENGAIEAIKTDSTYDEENHIDQISIQESDDMSLEHNDVDVPEDEDVEDTPNDTDADESNDIDEDDGDDWGDWRD